MKTLSLIFKPMYS